MDLLPLGLSPADESEPLAGLCVGMGSARQIAMPMRRGSLRPVKSDRWQLAGHNYYSTAQPLLSRSLNMNPLKYMFLQLIFWAFELKLWMDGRPWDEARFIVAERSRNLARATHERI